MEELVKRHAIFVALFFVSVLSADPPASRQASVEDQLDRLRQVIVDLEKSLKVDITRNRSAVETRIVSLETALKDLRKTSASADSTIDKRLHEMERVAIDLRQGLKVSQSRGKDHDREISDLRVSLKEISDKLSQLSPPTPASAGGDMFCEYAKEHKWRKGPHLLDPHLQDKSTVRGDRANDLFNAVERGCRKCGPSRKYWASPANATGKLMSCCETPTPQCQMEFGEGYLEKRCDFYDVTTCTLVDCVYTRSGESVTTMEKALKLVPSECRAPAKAAPSQGSTPTCSIRYLGYASRARTPQEKSFETTGVNLEAAIQAACNACSGHGNRQMGETNIDQLKEWQCRDLQCYFKAATPQHLPIPKAKIPKGCLFKYTRNYYIDGRSAIEPLAQ